MNGRGESATKSETLGEFAARMLIAMREVDDWIRSNVSPVYVHNFYSFRRLAMQMEHKRKYGPWFRVWVRKVNYLVGRSFEGQAFFFLKASAPNRWSSFPKEGAPPGIGAWDFIQVWPNERHKLRPIDKALKLDGRAFMADVRKRGWATR